METYTYQTMVLRVKLAYLCNQLSQSKQFTGCSLYKSSLYTLLQSEFKKAATSWHATCTIVQLITHCLPVTCGHTHGSCSCFSGWNPRSRRESQQSLWCVIAHASYSYMNRQKHNESPWKVKQCFFVLKKSELPFFTQSRKIARSPAVTMSTDIQHN